jgi:hypothetical protein
MACALLRGLNVTFSIGSWERQRRSRASCRPASASTSTPYAVLVTLLGLVPEAVLSDEFFFDLLALREEVDVQLAASLLIERHASRSIM